MESVIGLVNRLQRACTVLGDHGGDSSAADALPTLWEQLPSVAVVGGQSSGKSSVLESIVGKDFLPRGSGIVTRRPLVLQLHKSDLSAEYAEFLHKPNTKFIDWGAVRKEIADETDRVTGKTKMISTIPIHLAIHSPHVVNLTLIDLPGLTKIAIEGQSESIVRDIENMVRSYVEKPNCIILAISPANQDIATSDAMKLAREVDPTAERTWGVLTKLDLMDQGTNALEVLEGRAYRLKFPWIGVVNRSQIDINRSVGMSSARQKEREYFQNSSEYAHLVHRMGTEYLAKMLSKHLEKVILAKIPGMLDLINSNIGELEKELEGLGRPIGNDYGAMLYTVLESCRGFDKSFKDHLSGEKGGGERINNVFVMQLDAAFKKLPLDEHLSVPNVKRVVTESDGYQPHLVAPEQGYRRLIEGAIHMFKGPAEACVDQVHRILAEIARLSLGETTELQRFPSLQVEVSSTAIATLEKLREESRKTVFTLVDMESSYLTAEFFRNLPTQPAGEEVGEEKGGKGRKSKKGDSSSAGLRDRFNESHLKKIASNVRLYISLVMEDLRNSIPKAIVHCQVREAKRALMDSFYAHVGQRDGKELARILDEDPTVNSRRADAFKRLDLLQTARSEIDSAAWAS